MHRVFVPPDAIRGDQVIIQDAATRHHLCRVVRVRRGDRLECFDGTGRRYAGPIVKASAQELVVAVERSDEERPPRIAFTLAQAFIRPQRFEWVIQKAAELGVAAVIPIFTARTTIRPSAKEATSRRSRWQRIAQEAAAQCGRATVPTVHDPRPLSSVLTALGAYPALMLTLVADGLPLQEAAARLAGAAEAVIFIGPEGDFTAEEAALAKRHGVCAVRLGRLTLRSETAAIATLAILQHLMGEL